MHTEALDSALSDQLKAYGILPTRQRLEVARVLLSQHQHLSAEQIQERLALEAGEPPSRATVYNTLKLFVQHGLIREVVVDPQRIFFDSNNAPHHHYFHVDRGELSDLSQETIHISGLPELPPGLVREAVDVIIRVREA